ncbi:MAG: hypothetical protein J6T60_03820 [Bacteroidales bacterium]|nr:hypothetical protein [Bacteroidales bacterium]
MKKILFMLAVAIMAAAILCPAADAQEMSKKDFKTTSIRLPPPTTSPKRTSRIHSQNSTHHSWKARR